MTVTCCAAVYPRGTLWSLADCCKSGRHLTASQWQNRGCSGEGVLLFSCLFPPWGSVIKVGVHLLDYRKMPDMIGTAIRCAKTQHGLLCALQTHNQGQFVYVSATQQNLADFLNKIMQIQLWLQTRPWKVQANSSFITNYKCKLPRL